MKDDSCFFLHPWITVKSVVVLFLLTTVGATLQSYFSGHLNNYYAFSRPVINLLSGKSLYEYYGLLYDDFYRYSPTFALLVGLLHPLPDMLGLFIWNMVNTLAFVSGLVYFLRDSHKSDKTIIVVLLLVYLEWLISCQASQSNPLIAGMILWGAVWLKREKPFWAGLLFASCIFIKFYGAAAGIVFVFYPRKIQFLGAVIFWTAVLAVLPLLVTSAQHMEMQYTAWMKAIVSSPVGSRQLSVMGILRSWFGMEVPVLAVQVLGLSLSLLPLIRWKKYASISFQNLFLSSILIFLIIFNHMAESPTYIIAITGVALWYSTIEKISLWDKMLVVLMLVLCSNSNSDIFPLSVRKGFMEPFAIKAFPCLLVWLRIQYLLWTVREEVGQLSSVQLETTGNA
jgi:hypothetical protein